MNGYMDIHTASEKWNISDRRAAMLCREGKVPYAIKQNGIWQIPANTPKPADGRKRRGHGTSLANDLLLPLPIGISDFKETVTHYYYVDKTFFIKDLLDARPKVSLFTRPRRFGKTMNMDMLRTFFEISPEDTSVYFRNKNIWLCGESYTKHQGKYPVIFMTFKDVKSLTWKETFHAIRQIIQNEYNRHPELETSSKLTQYERDYYTSVLKGTLDSGSWPSTLGMLSQCLYKHYGVAPILIIDEYDTPIQQGHLQDFYEHIIVFMRNFFSSGVKDNPYLSFAFLTGILRVAKESIFSGMNNLKVNSILDERYSQYFGFTREDVQNLLSYYGKSDHMDEVTDWYDGYLFGSTDIFNPWSVINYLDDGCYPKAFWQSTGSNAVIQEIIRHATPEVLTQMHKLLQGNTISAYIDTSVIYPEIQNNPSTIYSFLLIAGYLKVVRREPCHDGNFICDVSVPNREISYVYEKEILSGLSDMISHSTAISIQQALYQQDIPRLQDCLQQFLQQTISFHDTAKESFYHGLVIGLCAIMNHSYFVSSNREAGDGRFDIQLLPRHKDLPGILMELKVLSGKEKNVPEKLTELSQTALLQITDKGYTAAMFEQGVANIMIFGIAFYKKQVAIAYEMQEGS